MKVLWIVQGIMKELSRQIGESAPVSGTWIEASKDSLKNREDVELHILCITANKHIEESISSVCEGVHYYLLPVSKKALVGGFEKNAARLINKKISEISPDIIHVHGTEFSVSLNIADDIQEKTPICHSIQGLVSVIAEKYFYAGINLNRTSPLVSLPTIVQRRQYLRRGKNEKKIIRRFKYFLGRTSWDRSHVTALNPSAEYKKVRELFREQFVRSKPWELGAAEKYTVFYAGGARVPLKGFHKFLDALEILKKRYPTVRAYVAGIVPNKRLPIFGKIGYGRYLDKKISQKGLGPNIVFTGPLTADQMQERFIKSHCYVLGSSIENSSNTMVEAMLVGVPSVVSAVGGVQDFCVHNDTSFVYRFEETEMLAYYVGKIFESDAISERLSNNSRLHIRELLNGSEEDLVTAYYDIVSRFNKR